MNKKELKHLKAMNEINLPNTPNQIEYIKRIPVRNNIFYLIIDI